MPPGDGRNHAVNQAAGRDTGLPAPAVDEHGAVEVGSGIEAAETESQQQTAQVGLAGVAAGPGEHLHNHWFSDGDRPVGRDELAEAPVGGAPGGPVVFDPGRGVGQDHAAPWGRASAGISAIAWAPRMARASSRVIGCPAR